MQWSWPHTHTHMVLPSIRWVEHTHTQPDMIKRPLRTSDMMTNVCWAAKASCCQHAGSWRATRRSARHPVHTLMEGKKMEATDGTVAACIVKHAKLRQSWKECWGGWQIKQNNKKHRQQGKAAAGEFETRPLGPGGGLTSRFVGVLGRHEVSVDLRGLCCEACWVERPRLASKRNPQVSIRVHFQHLPDLAEDLHEKKES